MESAIYNYNRAVHIRDSLEDFLSENDNLSLPLSKEESDILSKRIFNLMAVAYDKGFEIGRNS